MESKKVMNYDLVIVAGRSCISKVLKIQDLQRLEYPRCYYLFF